MKKRLLQIGAGVVILLVAAIVAVTLSLDRIIKSGVETVGPQIAQVEVKLAGVSHSLFSGKGEIKGLVIGNPEGFKSESAIKVGGVAVAVQPSTVFSQKIVVNSINVAAPEVTFEGGLKGNNLSKILANIDGSLGGASTTSTNAAASQKKLQVNDLMITDGKINVAVPGLMGKSATVPLPTIHLTDLGKDSDGITAADLSKRIMVAILESSTKAVGSMATELGKGVTDTATSLGKGAADSAEKVAKGIGDLFKKKK
ncbi:MAG: AsmA family protein [Verrucomicrobiales bacterium]|nr:AsmA family protein [Verrucomicrobiales bacterium]